MRRIAKTTFADHGLPGQVHAIAGRGSIIVIAETGDLGPAVVGMGHDDIHLIIRLVAMLAAIENIGSPSVDRTEDQSLGIAVSKGINRIFGSGSRPGGKRVVARYPL